MTRHTNPEDAPNPDPWAAWLRWRRYGQRSRRDFRLSQRVLFAGASTAARLGIEAIVATCRMRSNMDDVARMELLQGRTRAIFLLWHNRVPAFVAFCQTFTRRNPAFRMDSIISASKDGELLARPIREMSGGEIRGSSSSHAAAALRQAVESARKGANIATVGDGPRGPRYVVKPGPVLLAKATGLPVIPVTWAGSRVLQFYRAWDQMMVPLPFSAIDFRFGDPIHVAPDADPREIVRKRREMQGALDTLTIDADAGTRVRLLYPRPRAGEAARRKRGNAINPRRL